MENEKLQDLIAVLKKQGVESGEAAGRELVQEAQKQAEEIVAQAQKQAEGIVGQAKAEADKQMKQLRSALEIAASQFVSRLKGVIEENLLILPLEGRLVEELGKPEVLKDLLTRFVESYASNPENQEISLLLPESAGKELQDYATRLVFKHYGQGEKTGGGLEAQGVKFGFMVDKKDGNVRLDFTGEAFLALFLQFLSPRFRELFKDIKAEELTRS